MAEDESPLSKEYATCRSIVDRFDGNLLDLRKYGFTFITALITAQGFFTIGDTASPFIRVVIIIVTMILVVIVYWLDKYYYSLLYGAYFRSRFLEQFRLKTVRLNTFIGGINKKSTKKVLITIYAGFLVSLFVIGLFVILYTPSFVLQPESSASKPIILIFPSSSLAYSTIQVNGSGYNVNSTIIVAFDDKPVSITYSSSKGDVATLFKIQRIPIGSHIVTASDGTNFSSVRLSAEPDWLLLLVLILGLIFSIGAVYFTKYYMHDKMLLIAGEVFRVFDAFDREEDYIKFRDLDSFEKDISLLLEISDDGNFCDYLKTILAKYNLTKIIAEYNTPKDLKNFKCLQSIVFPK